MNQPQLKIDLTAADSPHFSLPAEDNNAPGTSAATPGQGGPVGRPLPADDKNVLAWEEVEAGRFMPRRVRGSCQGRALG